MPPSHAPSEPSDQTTLETANMVGIILSNITYGFQLALFVFLIRLHCIGPPKGTAGRPPCSRTNWSFLAYAIAVFLLATVGLCLQTSLNHRAFILHRGYSRGPLAYIADTSEDGLTLSTTAVYVVLNWFADGMILHRFYRLFGSKRQALFVSIVMLLSLVGVGTRCLRDSNQLAGNLWRDATTISSLAYLSVSLSINTFLTAAIIFRLLRYRSMFRRFYGNQDDRMYTFALCIIVESALPYTVVAILTVVACGIKSPMRNALLPLLGQLQAIPPLLIMVVVKWNRIVSDGGFIPTPVQTIQFVTETTTFDATATAASDKMILDGTLNLPSPPESCRSPGSMTFRVASPNWAPLPHVFSDSSHLERFSIDEVWANRKPEILWHAASLSGSCQGLSLRMSPL